MQNPGYPGAQNNQQYAPQQQYNQPPGLAMYSSGPPQQQQQQQYYQPQQQQQQQYSPNVMQMPPQQQQMMPPQGLAMNTSSTADALDGLLVYPALLVKQRPKGWMLELICGCESETEYSVYNPHDGTNEKILMANEHSNWLSRNCCRKHRPYTMTINTLAKQEIIRFERPLHGRKGCCCCFCWAFCFQTVRVYAGAATANPGKHLGCIREEYSWCVPVFSVRDVNDDVIYMIIGHRCGFFTYRMEIFDKRKGQDDTNIVGSIEKRWAGFAKELFTDADNFFITYPVNATANERALLFGAVFLLDFLFFENNTHRNMDPMSGGGLGVMGGGGIGGIAMGGSPFSL